VRFVVICAVVALGLGYYFRQDIAPGFLGPDNMPSATGRINSAGGGIFGGD
jgi:hypothetical protein